MLPVLQLRFMRFSRFRFDCIGNLHVGILPYLLVPTLPSKYAEYGLLLRQVHHDHIEGLCSHCWISLQCIRWSLKRAYGIM